jgi:hypothetical protein
MAASYFSTFDRSSELALWPFKSRVGGKPIRECQKHQSLQPALIVQQAQERKLPPHSGDQPLHPIYEQESHGQNDPSSGWRGREPVCSD